MLEEGNNRVGRDGHQLGLKGNQWSCNWLVFSVAVCVNTKLFRDLLAHSDWCLLVDLVTDLIRNILTSRVDNWLNSVLKLTRFYIVRNISDEFYTECQPHPLQTSKGF